MSDEHSDTCFSSYSMFETYILVPTCLYGNECKTIRNILTII